MRVAVFCEMSGRVREAFRRLGHDAWSFDLKPAEDGSIYHVQDDCLLYIRGSWDLAVCHPPCTYVACCQAWRCLRDPARAAEREKAVEFARKLWEADIPRIALENPKSQLSTMMAPKSQTIHPWQFGHEEFKETWLWLKNLPPLKPTNLLTPPTKAVEPDRFKAWEKVFRMGRKSTRTIDRSRTYQGIADAMAWQWGGPVDGR